MITLDVLRTVPLLADLEDAELREVAAAAADVRQAAGEWLVQEGQLGAFFLILGGDLEVTKTVAGAEQVINSYHAGDYSGEIPLLMGSAYLVSLRAVSDVRALRLDGVGFHTLIMHMTGIVGNKWSFDDFSPMDAIPTAVCLTSYAGESEDFMATPLEVLAGQIAAGTLHVQIGRIFTLEEIAEAHRCMEENKAGGKIVVLT